MSNETECAFEVSERALCREFRAARKRLKLTLRDVSRATGFSIPKVYRIERGLQSLRLRDVQTVARALRSSVVLVLQPLYSERS